MASLKSWMFFIFDFYFFYYVGSVHSPQVEMAALDGMHHLHGGWLDS